MAPLHEGAPPLSFEEVRQLVEAESSLLRLALDPPNGAGSSKGRYLVARRPIKAGEVVLAEWPLFHGTTKGTQSKKVYAQSFTDKIAETSPDTLLAELDDCFHPCSPLVDCLAGVLLSKRAAFSQDSGVDSDDAQRERQRLQKFNALCRAAVDQPVPLDCAADLWKVSQAEIQALTSEEDIFGLLHTMGSNRFGSDDASVEIMFAGSMFEHSCLPNCFVGGVWRARVADRRREYRASRDIAEGEALSIDYLLFPDAYKSAAQRAEILKGWGFACSCPRCQTMPEVTRAFVCPACTMPELCPRSASDESLLCQACGKTPEAAYAARCLAAEAALNECARTGVGSEGNDDFEGLIGPYHHIVFEHAWRSWFAGPDLGASSTLESLEDYEAATDDVIQCVTRLYGDSLHPQLLQVYHIRALLELGELEKQRHYLELERALIRRYYPEEADLQDAEILHMVHNKGPFCDGEASQGEPWKDEGPNAQNEDYPVAAKVQASTLKVVDPISVGDNWGLSEMD